MIGVEVPLNITISGVGKNGGRKGVGSAIRRRRTNKGGINIKEELFSETLNST